MARPTDPKATSKGKRFSPYGNGVPTAKAARKDGPTVVPPVTSEPQTELSNAMRGPLSMSSGNIPLQRRHPAAMVDPTVNAFPDVPLAVFDWNEVLDNIPAQDTPLWHQASAMPEDIFELQANWPLSALVTDPPTAMGPAAPGYLPRPQDLADLQYGAPAIRVQLDPTMARHGKRFSPYGSVVPRAKAIHDDVSTCAPRVIRPRAPKLERKFAVVPCNPRRHHWEEGTEDLRILNNVYRERLFMPMAVPDAPHAAKRPYIHATALRCAEHWRVVARFDWNNRHLPISHEIDYSQSIVHFLRYLEKYDLNWFEINKDRTQLRKIVEQGIREGGLNESVSNALKCLSAGLSCSFENGAITFSDREVPEYRHFGA
jgi:hypothetical protein